jgi:sodium-coupled monocarboxylate transporter 8/12
MWYTTIAVGTVLVVGIIVSYITGPLKPNEVDPKLLIPISDVFCCCLPKRIRDWLRCGVKEDVNLEQKVCLSIKKKQYVVLFIF